MMNEIDDIKMMFNNDLISQNRWMIEVLLTRIEELERISRYGVEKLHFEPGDVLLVKSYNVLNERQTESLLRWINEVLPCGVRATVQDPTVKIKVLR
jgi:hypothetical protein